MKKNRPIVVPRWGRRGGRVFCLYCQFHAVVTLTFTSSKISALCGDAFEEALIWKSAPGFAVTGHLSCHGHSLDDAHVRGVIKLCAETSEENGMVYIFISNSELTNGAVNSSPYS